MFNLKNVVALFILLLGIAIIVATFMLAPQLKDLLKTPHISAGESPLYLDTYGFITATFMTVAMLFLMPLLWYQYQLFNEISKGQTRLAKSIEQQDFDRKLIMLLQDFSRLSERFSVESEGKVLRGQEALRAWSKTVPQRPEPNLLQLVGMFKCIVLFVRNHSGNFQGFHSLLLSAVVSEDEFEVISFLSGQAPYLSLEEFVLEFLKLRDREGVLEDPA